MAETTELKIPFPLESDEANQGATKIKELAERVDLLLRKQLTKLFEVAKLKVTETLELPAESITEADLKKEAVTDAKVTKGRALVETENAYSAPTARAFATPFTPSATRLTFVSLELVHLAEPSVFTVKAGGVTITVLQPAAGGETGSASFCFPVPPGKTWEVTQIGGKEMKSSYLEI